MKNKSIKGWTVAVILLLCICACGRKKEESVPETATVPGTAQESEHESTAASAPQPSPAPSSVESRETEAAGKPEEDPCAEGYFYDEALSKALFDSFATANTNNTGEADPERIMTKAYLDQLNETAGKWLYNSLSDREAETALQQFAFRFQDDPPEAEHRLRTVRAAVYWLRGNDPATLADRIRLGNPEACFYLFLRAYYSETENRTRVYMINGLIW